MSLVSNIREQIIASFHAELIDHVQVMNDGLLALEQNKVTGNDREEILANIFRAAHSLKGAARAVGASVIEQLAHELENVLGGLQHNTLQPSAVLYTACYQAIDACQAVLTEYEAGEITPSPQAMQALSGLDSFRRQIKESPYPPTLAAAEAAGDSNAAHVVAPPAASATQASASQKPAEAQERSRKRSKKDSPSNGSDQTPASRKFGSKPTRSKEAASKDSLDILVAQLDEEIKQQKNLDGQLPVIDRDASMPLGSSSAPVGPADQPLIGEDDARPAPVTQPAFGDETIRVSVGKLDALLAQLSELLVTKIRAEQRLAQIRQAQDFMALWQKEWLAERSAYSWLVRQGDSDDGRSLFSRQHKEISRLLEYVDSSQNRLKEMSLLINKLSREYHSDTMQMSLVIDGLEEEIKRVRMLPLATITGSFGRMVRDLALASGKEVTLEILGGDVELDKRVLEQIKDPIIHLIRNAIDHGIENQQVRQAAGKPACGKVTIAAQQQGKDVAISVSDDGEGINIDAIRQAAIRRKIPNANSMTDTELVEQLYSSGFSTSAIITDVSGRGVGLDVVRRNIETLRGRITVEWEAGKGTTFTLFIPLTLTSSRCLLVRISGQLFAIPLNAIERIEYIHASDVQSVGGRDTLSYDGRPLMLAYLGAILDLPPTSEQHNPERIPVIILSAVERRMAIAVDELADEQEVVIKSLGKQLNRVGGIAGASVMGNGEAILVLNVAELIKLAQRDQQSILDRSAAVLSQADSDSQTQKRILVVDDSITTRTLEKNILEAAGFIVHLAVDGQEAYETLSSGDLPNIIISDVSMPRLDGIGLTSRIRSNPRTLKIPVILVTSLDSPEDKARGIEAGADAYLIKNSFDQNNLLETIEQFI